MPSIRRLDEMVDQVLSTADPDKGNINSKILHSLLHAVVSHLGIGNIEVEVPHKNEAVLKLEPANDSRAVIDLSQFESNGHKMVGENRVSGTKSDQPPLELNSLESTVNLSFQIQKLEKKIHDLERQWQELNSFPSNSELLDDIKYESKHEMNRARPVTDKWLLLYLTKKVDANTEGVTKSLSLLEDFVLEIETLRKICNEAGQQLEELKELQLSREREALILQQECLDSKKFDDVWTRLLQYETELKAGLASLPLSLNAQTLSEPQSLLNQTEKLSEQHRTVWDQIEQLKSDVAMKADRIEIGELGDHHMQIMNDLLNHVNILKQSNGQCVELVNHLQSSSEQLQLIINHLQETVDNLTEATQRLSDESIIHQNHIETLFCSCKELGEKKADKEFVETEVANKADKEHLEEKVSCENFDSTCGEINASINSLITKILGQEDDWKQTISQLNVDIGGKLDRLEFGPVKDELEGRLRKFAKKMAAAGLEGRAGEITDEEAAGFRRQLIQNFHCLSCNKPLDMKPVPRRVIPSIPAVSGLPETQSLRPYTVFELNHIRQLAQSQTQQQSPHIQELLELYSTARFCGGSHTLTFPHRRLTKLSITSHLNPNGSPSAGPPPPQPRPLHLTDTLYHQFSRRHNSSKLPGINTSATKPFVKKLRPQSNLRSQSGSPELATSRHLPASND